MHVRLFHTIAAEERTSSEVYAHELASGLHRILREGQPSGSAKDGDKRDSVTVTHWEPNGKVRLLVGRLGPLARLAGQADRYIVYQWQAHGLDADVNHIVEHGYGHLAFSLDPARTVVTFHDAVLLKLQKRELATDAYPWITTLGHKLSLKAISRVAQVIADSESSKQDFLRFVDYPPERVHVIPLGVSARFRPPAHSVDCKDKEGPKRILHVGHCGVYKNIEGILRSLPLIAKRLGESVMFIKVGGPFTVAQRKLIGQLGLEQWVQHLGVVPSANLPLVYAQADVLLMPSLYEGFGLPILEAMACGTPVVASNQGSLPEVVGDAGLMVEPTDIEAIADAVVRVLMEPSLHADLRHRGLEHCQSFPWERTARETLAVYQAVYYANA